MENSILVLETGGLYNQGLPSWLCQSRQLRTELGLVSTVLNMLICAFDLSALT